MGVPAAKKGAVWFYDTVLEQPKSPIMATCANPGCDQPGTNQCSACKTTPYCGPICQTAHWGHHKEECTGHLRKVGMAHLEKANGFLLEQNWPQTLRHADLAATKLKQMKDRPVELIDNSLNCKYNALNFMNQHREALECAKEWYLLWPTKHTHPHAIAASFSLIESSMHNREFFDAALYARTLWETITLSRDSHIPDHLREDFTARGASELARATLALAQSGGMPAEEQREAGREAIMLARRALEIDTRLHGAESYQVADDQLALGSVLNYFNDVDDDEAIRLYEQAKSIFVRSQGSESPNVAVCERNLGGVYQRRARRTIDTHDLDCCVANLELALSHLREAGRIFRAINHLDKADHCAGDAIRIEGNLRQVVAKRAATTRA